MDSASAVGNLFQQIRGGTTLRKVETRVGNSLIVGRVVNGDSSKPTPQKVFGTTPSGNGSATGSGAGNLFDELNKKVKTGLGTDNNRSGISKKLVSDQRMRLPSPNVVSPAPACPAKPARSNPKISDVEERIPNTISRSGDGLKPVSDNRNHISASQPLVKPRPPTLPSASKTKYEHDHYDDSKSNFHSNLPSNLPDVAEITTAKNFPSTNTVSASIRNEGDVLMSNGNNFFKTKIEFHKPKDFPAVPQPYCIRKTYPSERFKRRSPPVPAVNI